MAATTQSLLQDAPMQDFNAVLEENHKIGASHRSKDHQYDASFLTHANKELMQRILEQRIDPAFSPPEHIASVVAVVGAVYDLVIELWKDGDFDGAVVAGKISAFLQVVGVGNKHIVDKSNSRTKDQMIATLHNYSAFFTKHAKVPKEALMLVFERNK